MRTRNKLNVKQVASLNKPGIYSDGGGLYLRVRPSGTRSWLYVCIIQGKRRELGLGSVLDVSLAKAREKAAVAREQFLEGLDPVVERAKARVPVEPPLTFGKFALSHLDDIVDGFKNSKHRQQWRNTLVTYAGPLFELPLAAVETKDVLAVLQPIWLTKSETASRVRQRIEKILDAATANGLRQGDNPARARGHLDLLLPKRIKTDVRHHAALPFKEMAAFMRDLRRKPGTAARGLEFAILTAARSGELRGMLWSEVDLEQGIWTVPGERMKAGVMHQVPLSDAAQSVLRSMVPSEGVASGLVFPAPRGGAMSDMTLAAVLKRMKRTTVTVHGFRSSFRDWAGDATDFDREEVEMALAHSISSATERAYRRGRALEKRRKLMAAWAEYCCGAQPTD